MQCDLFSLLHLTAFPFVRFSRPATPAKAPRKSLPPLPNSSASCVSAAKKTNASLFRLTSLLLHQAPPFLSEMWHHALVSTPPPPTTSATNLPLDMLRSAVGGDDKADGSTGRDSDSGDWGFEPTEPVTGKRTSGFVPTNDSIGAKFHTEIASLCVCVFVRMPASASVCILCIML